MTAGADHLTTAIEALDWVRTQLAAADTSVSDHGLYAGTSGVIVALIEAYRTTQADSFLAWAEQLAGPIVASLKSTESDGLYVGLAGIGFVLAELAAETGRSDLSAAARGVPGLLRRRAISVGAGVAWNESTDVVSGAAGTGLYLLWAGHRYGDDDAIRLATEAAHRLIELAEPAQGGLSWPMAPDFPRLMPNFSHGTAGVAYFLARIALVSGDRQFLEPAVEGSHHLLAVANEAGLVHYHEPDATDLYYLGWCHGPVGTGRLYHQLALSTGDDIWTQQLQLAGRSLVDLTVPVREQPGFWNNVGQCCGSAGIAEFLIHLQGQLGDTSYGVAARALTDDLMERATTDREGTRWIHAEHRLRPEEAKAQPGYMHGSAGIIAWLLRLSRLGVTSAKPWVVFPDCPFPSPG